MYPLAAISSTKYLNQLVNEHFASCFLAPKYAQIIALVLKCHGPKASLTFLFAGPTVSFVLILAHCKCIALGTLNDFTRAKL